MTITAEQLDELERKAKAALPGPWEHIIEKREPGLGYEHTIRQTREASRPPYPQHGICRTFEWRTDGPDATHIAANSPDVTLRLVAVYRAALACSEAKLRIARARDALDDLGTRSSRADFDDALDDLDQCQAALDAAVRGTP